VPKTLGVAEVEGGCFSVMSVVFVIHIRSGIASQKDLRVADLILEQKDSAWGKGFPVRAKEAQTAVEEEQLQGDRNCLPQGRKDSHRVQETSLSARKEDRKRLLSRRSGAPSASGNVGSKSGL